MAIRDPIKDSITRPYASTKIELDGSILLTARIIVDVMTAKVISCLCPMAFEIAIEVKIVKIKDNCRDSKNKWNVKKRKAPKTLPRTL